MKKVMKRFKTRILQKMADSVVDQLQLETNEAMFNMLFKLGLWLDMYAVQHDIWLE